MKIEACPSHWVLMVFVHLCRKWVSAGVCANVCGFIELCHEHTLWKSGFHDHDHMFLLHDLSLFKVIYDVFIWEWSKDFWFEHKDSRIKSWACHLPSIFLWTSFFHSQNDVTIINDQTTFLSWNPWLYDLNLYEDYQ